MLTNTSNCNDNTLPLFNHVQEWKHQMGLSSAQNTEFGMTVTIFRPYVTVSCIALLFQVICHCVMHSSSLSGHMSQCHAQLFFFRPYVTVSCIALLYQAICHSVMHSSSFSGHMSQCHAQLFFFRPYITVSCRALLFQAICHGDHTTIAAWQRWTFKKT